MPSANSSSVGYGEVNHWEMRAEAWPMLMPAASWRAARFRRMNSDCTRNGFAEARVRQLAFPRQPVLDVEVRRELPRDE